MPGMKRSSSRLLIRAGVRLLVLSLVLPSFTSSCVIVDRPLLHLRSIAGGIHNRRRVNGIRPFFLPDGRIGLAANGGLLIQAELDGPLVRIAGLSDEVDDPSVSPDGRALIFVSGRDQVTAGGGHNDHVFQIYSLDLDTLEWRRITRSERAETLPRFNPDGSAFAFVRRPEYDGWSLEAPWGKGAVYLANADGTNERQLSEALFHPYRGLEFARDGATLIFGAAPDSGTFNVYALDLDGEGEPRLLVSNAYLPTPVPESTDMLVARVLANGRYGLARHGPGGEFVHDLGFDAYEIIGLALSPDGQRVVYSDFDPEARLFGEHRLWEVSIEGGTPRLLETLEFRLTTRMKPGDLVRPLSWWFRPGASPGSR